MKCSMSYFERVMPEEIDRTLLTMAMFYTARGQHKVAEDLVTQVLEKHERNKDKVTFTTVMALNIYASVIMVEPQR